ncbi:unnamed protein product [Nezara viridula]|uniref:Uncharacterized protein n=1 Tax=Nezara viridula TaxID=85310 RepID=A0A9P0E6Q0_NEZVI|nr:unnamed protein product [Nezara viridula]
MKKRSCLCSFSYSRKRTICWTAGQRPPREEMHDKNFVRFTKNIPKLWPHVYGTPVSEIGARTLQKNGMRALRAGHMDIHDLQNISKCQEREIKVACSST